MTAPTFSSAAVFSAMERVCVASANVGGVLVVSVTVIVPLSAAVEPVAPPPRPAAVRRGVPLTDEAGIDTTIESSSVSASASAVSSTVAASAVAPLSGPVKVTVEPAKVTPAGSGVCAASVKSVLRTPPANASGTARLSPATRPRPRVSAIEAVSVELPSSAAASGVVSVTVVASLSSMSILSEASLDDTV